MNSKKLLRPYFHLVERNRRLTPTIQVLVNYSVNQQSLYLTFPFFPKKYKNFVEFWCWLKNGWIWNYSTRIKFSVGKIFILVVRTPRSDHAYQLHFTLFNMNNVFFLFLVQTFFKSLCYLIRPIFIPLFILPWSSFLFVPSFVVVNSGYKFKPTMKKAQ